MISLFNTFFYDPIYNGLIFLIGAVPGGNVGIAIILLTISVKFIILPLTHKSVASQAKMRSIEPEVAKVKKKYAKDKQEQGRKIMELYQKHGINPFSGCLFVIIQIPIILALYWVFFKGLASFNGEILYSFVTLPANFTMSFLGIDMLGKSFIIALFAGVSQYYQISLSMPPRPRAPVDKNQPPSFKEEFARNMGTQIRYVLPVVVFFVSYTISAAVALYWFTSNLFSIAHELFVRKKAGSLPVATETKEV